MKLFTIADLHLAVGVNKPMDIFGGQWENYMQRIRDNWMETVSKEDVVLMPGDFCWAMYLEQAIPDFQFLENLPGTKILLKGNHDYWWTTMSKLEQFMINHGFGSIKFLHNNHIRVGNYAICGTRGWNCPQDNDFDEEDLKIYKRELQRLRLSLESANAIANEYMIVALHYPPFGQKKIASGFVDILEEYGVTTCVYGHLHGAGSQNAVQGTINGVEYRLVASDFINFRPVFLTNFSSISI